MFNCLRFSDVIEVLTQEKQRERGRMENWGGGKEKVTLILRTFLNICINVPCTCNNHYMMRFCFNPYIVILIVKEVIVYDLHSNKNKMEQLQ